MTERGELSRQTMPNDRYLLTTWQGEGRTLWYVYDERAADTAAPVVVKTFNSVEHTLLDAQEYVSHKAAHAHDVRDLGVTAPYSQPAVTTGSQRPHRE